MPRPPAHLSAQAAREWRWLARATVSLGTLSAADLRALELLATVLAVETEARATLEREGLTIEAGSGGRKSHPAAKIAAEARAQATRLLESFGLTPKSRQSVDVLPAGSARNPADHYLLGGSAVANEYLS